MAKRVRGITEDKINNWIKSGRGQNHGRDYFPWLTIQDVPSLGLVSRTDGWKTGRIHHFMSNIELKYFLILEWSDSVVDVREQYPLLPLSKTVEIANSLGIVHPRDPVTKKDIVMTTDFLLDIREGNEVRHVARTVKESSDINSYRVIEKLEIERVYWKERKINWGVISDSDIPEQLAANIDWVYTAKSLKDYKIPMNLVNKVEDALFTEISNESIGLSDAALTIDDRFGLPAGTCLTIARHLIENKVWQVDMYEEVVPTKHTPIVRNKQLGLLERVQ